MVKLNFQSEDEALARALAESERISNGDINNSQQRCSVSWNEEPYIYNTSIILNNDIFKYKHKIYFVVIF